jgi:hypothetical protein
MDEKEIERIAARLGADAGNEINVDRVAQGVLARLRAAEAEDAKVQIKPARWWQLTPVLRAAVLAFLLVTGGIIGVRVAGDRAITMEEIAALPELDDFSDNELTEVLDSLYVDVPVSELAVVGLYDMNESELEALLQAMEG